MWSEIVRVNSDIVRNPTVDKENNTRVTIIAVNFVRIEIIVMLLL